MWYALLLACGSSTDNFAVGLSLGLSHKPLRATDNAIISALNAAGAYASAAGGHLLGELAPTFAALFAAVVFAYLAAEELISWRQRGKGEATTATLGTSGGGRDALRIALPMTLNNLAGGVAGGVAGGAVGIDARAAGVLALVASYGLMQAGHLVGAYLVPTVGRCVDPRILSGSVFGALALVQLKECMG